MRCHHLARAVVRAVATATASGSSQRGFYFVSASYQGRSLLSAATELALTVREAMGPDRPPHLITLFATPHSEWGAGLADTPQYVRELLTYEGAQPPVIVGGVLRSVAGGAGGALSKEGGTPCVALLAAHLPGVRLMPFHTTGGSLPALPGDGWAEVLRTTRAISSAKAAAAESPAAPAAAEPDAEAAAVGAVESGQGRSGGGGAAAMVGLSSSERPAGGSDGGGGGSHAAGPGCGPAGPEMRASSPAPGAREGQSHPHPHPRQQQAAAGREGVSGSAAAAAAADPAAGNPERQPTPGGTTSSASVASASAPCSVAALLMSTPHFVEVEELLRRFGQVAPGMQVIGGVTSPGAWGDSESNWGAVWLNDRTYAQGAVGCVLQGPFQLDTVVSPGFRGAGPVMRVTQAHGQYVLELDGEPVQRPLQRAISEALNSGELATSLKIGLGDAAVTASAASSSSSSSGSNSSNSSSSGGSGNPQQQHRQHRHRQQQAVFPSQPLGTNRQPDLQAQALGGAPTSPSSRQPPQPPQQPPPQQQAASAAISTRQFLTRNWFFQQGPPRPFMTVQSSAPIVNGTLIQVHLQNYPAAHRHMRDRLRQYAEALPAEVAAAEGRVGALALSCCALPFFEGPDVERCLPRAALAGGKVEGEFCSTVEGQPSRLHSFTSCLAFLRAAGT